MIKPTLQCPCDRQYCKPAFSYDAAPDGETRFDLNGADYQRSYDRCDLCGHYFSRHDIDLDKLYESAYVSATYCGREGMAKTFARIINLPVENSDNSGRVSHIAAFAESYFPAAYTPRLLDVGSGLGVFPYAIKQLDWEVLALDPDPEACRHIEQQAGVATVQGDFFRIDPGQTGLFDVITFNKVLEHVEDPVSLLAHAAGFLNEKGCIYVELPDGEAAAEAGKGREEFFIEHHHVFSFASIVLLGQAAKLKVIQVERLQEPSSKYTLRAFMVTA